jgi:hypothetical protein
MISKGVLNEHLMINEKSMLIILSNNVNNDSKKLLFNLFKMNLKNDNPSVLYLFKNGLGDNFYSKFVKENIIINKYYYLTNDYKNMNDKFIILNNSYKNKKAFIFKKTGNTENQFTKINDKNIFNLTNTRSELRENVIKNKIFTLKNINGKRKCPTKIINTDNEKWPKSSDLNPLLVLQNINCLVVLRLEETYEPLLNCDENKLLKI